MIKFLLFRIPSCLLLLFSIAACAQTSHEKNVQWLHQMDNTQSGLVLLHNQSDLVPLKQLENRRIASIAIGRGHYSVFDSILNKYAAVDRFSNYDAVGQKMDINSLSEALKFYNTLIIQLNADALSDPSIISFIQSNEHLKPVILVMYGTANLLGQLERLNAPVLYCPTETEQSAFLAAEAVFGGIAVNGKLNVNASAGFRQGDGYATHAIRLSYTVPEAAGINADDLEPSIDKIMAYAISQKATPGGVVLAAKDGKVIFNKAYGTWMYGGNDSDKVTDIFDLASVTKICATTMEAMRLYDEHKLNLDTNVATYVLEAKGTNKENIKIRDLLLHQAGLVPYIPFYEYIKSGDYSRDSSELYSVKVADNYYLRKGYYESVMWPQMLHSHLETPGKYVYSDLSMYFMKEVEERITAKPLSNYVAENFYQPLGMRTAGYNPRYRFSRDQIVPTEQDNYFRHTLVQGFVHDQGAAMAGGVSGHAGLFASTNDLAILFQMMLNGGTYGGVQYLKPGTINLFTSRQSEVSRRGLGFDRWDPLPSRKYPSDLASPQTYGHTGFTGTCVWVDPKYNLIYVFLSNRVISGGSNRLASLDIRSSIQDAIYQAILKGQQ